MGWDEVKRGGLTQKQKGEHTRKLAWNDRPSGTEHKVWPMHDARNAVAIDNESKEKAADFIRLTEASF